MNMITVSVTILFLTIICDSALFPSGEITHIEEARDLDVSVSKDYRRIIQHTILRYPNLPVRPMSTDWPMANGESRTFEFQGKPRCYLQQKEYVVRKTQENKNKSEGIMVEGMFVASINSENGEIIQVATASCLPGWIDNIEVEDDARGCGIGTVLTELCLIDPYFKFLYPFSGFVTNKAILFLNDYPVQLDHVETYCRRGLMGMLMTAESHKDLGVANAYFNAALKQGYNRMLIFEHDEQEFHYLWVRDAKRLYQTDFTQGGKPGWIGNKNEQCHCNDCDLFEAYDRTWFFCKDT